MDVKRLSKKSESEMILSFIEDLESIVVDVNSRYGDHEATKKHLKNVVK